MNVSLGYVYFLSICKCIIFLVDNELISKVKITVVYVYACTQKCMYYTICVDHGVIRNKDTY